jgi:hypothetical protein
MDDARFVLVLRPIHGNHVETTGQRKELMIPSKPLGCSDDASLLCWRDTLADLAGAAFQRSPSANLNKDKPSSVRSDDIHFAFGIANISGQNGVTTFEEEFSGSLFATSPKAGTRIIA